MEAKTQPEKSDVAQGFERLYYAEVDPEELAARRASDLAGAAASHLEFGRSFSSGKPKIRAYNPTPAQDGWQSSPTGVEIINDDMPFLVDSVTMEVNRQGLTLHLVIHPVLRTVRSRAGQLESVSAPGESSGGRLESFMHLEVDRRTDPAKLAELEAGLARVLGDVRAAVLDFGAMKKRMAEVLARLDEARSAVSQPELEEGRAYLDWLIHDHFTFLGCRDYVLERAGGEDVLRIVPGSGLGILRERGETLSLSFAGLPAGARQRAPGEEVLVAVKGGP